MFRITKGSVSVSPESISSLDIQVGDTISVQYSGSPGPWADPDSAVTGPAPITVTAHSSAAISFVIPCKGVFEIYCGVQWDPLTLVVGHVPPVLSVVPYDPKADPSVLKAGQPLSFRAMTHQPSWDSSTPLIDEGQGMPVVLSGPPNGACISWGDLPSTNVVFTTAGTYTVNWMGQTLAVTVVGGS